MRLVFVPCTAVWIIVRYIEWVMCLSIGPIIISKVGRGAEGVGVVASIIAEA